MTIEEIWKDIEGFEGIYQVSNYGRVKSLRRLLWNGKVWHMSKEKIMKPSIDCNGYPLVGLRNKDGMKYMRVHRLVALAFIPNPNNYRVVNHIDADRANNYVDNLEWCTHKHNTEWANKLGSFDHSKRKVRVIETGIIYKSIHDCAKSMSEFNVDFRHVSDCINGKLKSHKGFHFEAV